MMSKNTYRNTRKAEVLALLAGLGGWVTSYDVAEALQISSSNACNLLRNYSSSGLINRRRVVPEVGISYHEYKLGANGRKRLAWLLSHNAVDRPEAIKPRVVKVIKPNVLRKKVK
jgi:predicted transcriptional regulator